MSPCLLGYRYSVQTPGTLALYNPLLWHTHPGEMSSPRSIMSFSSACAEPGSCQPSPESNLQSLEPMECESDHVGDITVKSGFEGMNFELEEHHVDGFRLEPPVAESAQHSDLGMDYSTLRSQHWFSSIDAPYSERVGDFHSLDAQFSDLPPPLEPAYTYDMDAIFSFLEGAASKGICTEDHVEKENVEGRALEKGKGKARDKGKVRVSPYPRERSHIRATAGVDWQALLSSFPTNTGSCFNDTTSDLLTKFRNHPLLFSEGHSSGDPSGCGVPHHDDS